MSVESVQTVPPYRPTALMFGVEPPDSSDAEGSQQESAPVVREPAASEVIQFAKDPVSDTMMMRIVDPDSGEVVRQIPPEDMVAISRMLGLLFDKVA